MRKVWFLCTINIFVFVIACQNMSIKVLAIGASKRTVDAIYK